VVWFWLLEVIQARKSDLGDSAGVTQLVSACLTLVGHLLYQCCDNQARFIQLHGKHVSVHFTGSLTRGSTPHPKKREYTLF